MLYLRFLCSTISLLLLLNLSVGCKVYSGDSDSNFGGPIDAATLRSESFPPVVLPSVHPTPEAGTTVNQVVDVRQTYKVAFVMLIHEDLNPDGAVALRNIAKLENLKLHLQGQFVNSTDGKGALDLTQDVVVLSVPSPFYDVTQESLMVSTTQEHITDLFYAQYPDDFDFLAIFTDFSEDLRWGSRHLEVTPTVGGFGRGSVGGSDAASWGSAGQLKAVGMVKDINQFPETYDFANSHMNLVLHEVFGHHWGAFVPETTSGGGHFAAGVQAPTFTVMYGRPWTQVDPTTFEVVDTMDAATNFHRVTFHPWTLYHAGLLNKAEVPDQILSITLDQMPTARYDVYSTTGTAVTLDIDEIISTYGDRTDL